MFFFFVRVDFQFLLRMAFTFHKGKRSMSDFKVKVHEGQPIVKVKGQGHLKVKVKDQCYSSVKAKSHPKVKVISRSNSRTRSFQDQI